MKTEQILQGECLSPLLFTIYMKDKVKECSRVARKLHVVYKNLQRMNMSDGALGDVGDKFRNLWNME